MNLIELAKNKNFAEFQTRVKDSLDAKIASHDYIKEKTEEFQKYSKMKDIYSSIER